MVVLHVVDIKIDNLSQTSFWNLVFDIVSILVYPAGATFQHDKLFHRLLIVIPVVVRIVVRIIRRVIVGIIQHRRCVVAFCTLISIAMLKTRSTPFTLTTVVRQCESQSGDEGVCETTSKYTSKGDAAGF